MVSMVIKRAQIGSTNKKPGVGQGFIVTDCGYSNMVEESIEREKIVSR